MAETRGLNKDSTERVNLIFYGQVKADSHFEAETLKILLVLFKYSQAREERIIIYLASKRMVGMVWFFKSKLHALIILFQDLFLKDLLIKVNPKFQNMDR